MNLQFFLAQSMPDCTNMTLCWVIYTIWSTIGLIWVISRSLNPAAAWGWCGAMILCPPLATLLYLLVAEGKPKPTDTKCHPSYSRLQNAIANGCGATLTMSNTVTPLHNANRTFSALIRDLQRAQREICIEYYILSNDRIAKVIFDILCRRAHAGVRVRIIYDAIGSWQLKRSQINVLRESGVEIRPYGKLKFPYLTPSVHRRNHRKLVIIDAQTIYLGGINIASRYLGKSKLGYWRDEHIKIEGSVVQQAQALFLADWTRCGGKPFTPYHPLRIVRTACPVQLTWAEDGASRNTLESMILEAIATARHNIRISTPYFLPTQAILTSLCSAARSGVSVELLVPHRPDVKIIALAAEGFIGRCAESGVKVYRYRNGFLHSKTITIDDSITIVGSANVDYRSLRYNLELSAIIYNRAITTDYISRFYVDVAMAVKVKPLRPTAWQLIKQGFARLLAPIL